MCRALLSLVVMVGLVGDFVGRAAVRAARIKRRLAQTTAHSATLAPADRDAVMAVTKEYRDAWVANDGARVMALFTPDAILLPSGLAAITGETAIRAFWFPTGGPRTTVTAMEQEVTDVTGSANRAVVTGRGSLSFRLGDDVRSRTQASWFANVLIRQPDGRWLISRRIWVDLP